MAATSQLDGLRRAVAARDPVLVPLLVRLAESPTPPPDKPVRDGAPTLARWFETLRSRDFRKKTRAEQRQYRVEQMRALEAPDAEAPLPERLRVHELILDLWKTNDAFSRSCLLDLIAEVPLVYGPWRALKKIFKEAEAASDTEVLGALAARFDQAYAAGQRQGAAKEVGTATLGYLARRGWRFLRRLGQTLPACYADAACDLLARYPEETDWRRTWIANHIFHHETGDYARSQFHFKRHPSDLLKNRAFAEAWKRTPRPLFSLLERARAEHVRKFATEALKTDFRATLREVEPAWVARLAGAGSGTIDEFVVWILKNVPQFEHSKFRELGLHDAVLRLFDSPSDEARKFAAEYVRTHVRDLPLERLIRLANNSVDEVQKLVRDLLKERDARKDIGLAAWGRLLNTDGAHELAAETLRKQFTAAELTPAWFTDVLLGGQPRGVEFACGHLTKVHPAKSLGAGFFVTLIERSRVNGGYTAHQVTRMAASELERFDLNQLDKDSLKLLLLHPMSQWAVLGWVHDGRLKAESFPVDFLKLVAFHPDWDASDAVKTVKQSEWAKDLQFSETLSERVLGWLGDVRAFSPVDLTFDWLMKLVQRAEPRYHDFAVETMIKVFLPADFAPKEPAAAPAPGGVAAPGAGEAPTVDLGGASFLFTGKLATMTRDVAEGKVTHAGGSNASSVTAKLDYLVIGDEGSPLYGQGRKGSKQTKAESLIAGGAPIKIISETAFLQMLVGGVREVSSDQTEAGCRRLWEMLTGDGPEDAPLRKFARKYLRRHHPDICLKETDRPVDPGAEIPLAFLSLDRLQPLFFDSRKPLRDLALEFASWEFARWAPPIEALVALCEAPASEVREFVAKALTADDLPDHRRFRLNADVLTPEAVYSFCESRDAATRLLGMHLIEKNARLQLPEELFRLTESPDRKVRAFVIRAFWSLYRDRGITDDWKPQPPPQTTVGKKAKEKADKATREAGPGAPKHPDNPPAANADLRDFLRRILFEIPPGRPEKDSGGGSAVAADGPAGALKSGTAPKSAGAAKSATITTKLKPLPTRKSKLLLVETLRDLACEEREIAVTVLPLLEEFQQSFGPSEFAACVVAVTRIQATHASTTAG